MPRLLPLAAVIVAAALPSSGVELARSSVSTGKSFEYARDLTAIGSRVTGSASYRRAAEWSADRFRAMGIGRVSLEPFTIERGWERVSARGRLVAPSDRTVHVESLGWAPSTPDGGIEAEVVAVNTFSLATLASDVSVRGRMVLLPEGDPAGDQDTVARITRGLAVALHTAGALAILVQDSDAANQLSARPFAYGGSVTALPVGQIGRGDAEMLREQLARGPVRLSLELINRITAAPATVDNVIAEIRGRERPDEWVVVGAHLDAWDFATGAQDNATGVAMVLEAARAIAALPEPPRRSIRFALWGGEEQGQLGSNAYVRSHASELDRLIASLNADAGTGRIIGWTAAGRPEVARSVRSLARDFLDELGAATFDESLRYAFESDGGPFLLAGIPMLDLNADDTRYEEIHHKGTDTLDRVDARALAVGAAMVAATARAIADAPQRIAPRLDAHAVERLKHKGG